MNRTLATFFVAAALSSGSAISQDAIKIGVTQPLTGAFAASHMKAADDKKTDAKAAPAKADAKAAPAKADAKAAAKDDKKMEKK